MSTFQTVKAFFLLVAEGKVSDWVAVKVLGRNIQVDTAGPEDVIGFGGLYQFPDVATVITAVSDDAGDTFAGGFLGYLAATGEVTNEALRRATVIGSVMGSFTVESFSADRLSSLNLEDIDGRVRAFADLSRYTPFADGESLPWRDGINRVNRSVPH